MNEKQQRLKIVVFTGAGVSAESGLDTFRDPGGLWQKYDMNKVATPMGWAANPALVLEFYNKRRRQLAEVEPNEAHFAIGRLEEKFDVSIVTQNVDNLHERGGSTHVVHVHGQLVKARSTADPDLVYDIGTKDINLGDKCGKGSQLRPHIVWWGEEVRHMDLAGDLIRKADKILVIGTSLSVWPAAGLLQWARPEAEKIIVAPEIDQQPAGFRWLDGKAVELVPGIVEKWLGGG